MTGVLRALLLLVVLAVTLGACGTESSNLHDDLEAIDQAVAEKDYDLAREEIASLLRQTAQADLEPAKEEAIESAATALLKRIAATEESTLEPTPEPTPSQPAPTTPPPSPEAPAPVEEKPDKEKGDKPEKPEKDDKDDKDEGKRKDKKDKD